MGDTENDEDIMDPKNKKFNGPRRAEVERQPFSIIKERKIGYLGHILRGEKYALLRLIVEGEIERGMAPEYSKSDWSYQDWEVV